MVSLLLRHLVQPNPQYGATHDDELMVRMAASILRGEWLGSYADHGHMILSKPAGYPLFLAWTHFLPWAPTMTVHFILLSGVVLVARELRAIGLRRGAVLLFVALSALQPQWFGSQMSRIYRDGFFAALVFLGLGLSLWLGRVLPIWANQRNRNRRAAAQVTGLAILCGVTLSWSIATKPSWYPLALVMVAFVMRSLLAIRQISWRIWFPRLVVVGLSAILGLASVSGYVMLQNKKHYGVLQLDSFSSGSFPKAFNEWSSVKSDDTRKYILVDASQRKRVYGISEVARKLKPYLELTWGNGWRGSACSSPLKICDESATWFVWDLRDAMHSAGLDNSASQFEKSFAQLSRDISDACATRRITCSGGGLAPGLVSFADMSKREVVDAYATALDWIAFPDIGYTARGGKASGNPDIVNEWDQVVKGLPSRAELNSYRPEVTALGNSISLLQRFYAIFWPFMIALVILGVVTSPLGPKSVRTRRFISVCSAAGIVLFVGQLALLEASSGMYLSTGKANYLLPVFPFLLVAIAVELDVLGDQVDRWKKPAITSHKHDAQS